MPEPAAGEAAHEPGCLAADRASGICQAVIDVHDQEEALHVLGHLIDAASQFSAALRETTPRTELEAAFSQAPTDESWREWWD